VLLRHFDWERDILAAPGPILVNVHARWSPPCRMMNRIALKIARQHAVCFVDIDRHPDLTDSLGIQAVPTLLILRDGRIVSRHLGVIWEATLRSEMEQLPTASTPPPSFATPLPQSGCILLGQSP
jgi:thioredoxin 2